MPKPEHVSGFLRLLRVRDEKDGRGVPASLRGAESGSRNFPSDGKWIDWSWECGPPGMQVKSFSNAAEVELDVHQKHADRVMRPLPAAGFDSSLWVIGHYTIMVSTRQKPHYLVEIHDTVLTRNQRQLFKSLWTSAAV